MRETSAVRYTADVGDTELSTGAFDAFEQHMVVGAELLRQNRVLDARRELEAAAALKPDDVKALGLLGLACFRLNAFDEALPVYEKLVAIEGDDAAHRLNLGLVYLKRGETAPAIRELNKSRDLDPSQRRTIGYIGLAHARSGEYAKAYEAFLQAGQEDLATEMAQYLSADVRRAIADAVKGGARPPEPDAGTKAPAADPVQAPVASSQPISQPGFTPGQATEEDEDDLVFAIEDSGSPPANDKPEVKATATPRARAVSDSGAIPVNAIAEEGTPASGIVIAPNRRAGAITQAVERAAPSGNVAAAPGSVGHLPPRTLSDFVTSRLVRPDDSEHPFETAAGGVLIIRVKGKMYARTEGVDVSGGDLAYEAATQRVRGTNTHEPFDDSGRTMFVISGRGHLVAARLGGHFSAVTLDDDILYLRRDLVFAFEPDLRWENGFVPGVGRKVPIVQFRGEGAVAMRSELALYAVKLVPDRPLYVDVTALAGWVGRVVPRGMPPLAGGRRSEVFVECTGEGVVLVEEEGSADSAPTPSRGSSGFVEASPASAAPAETESTVDEGAAAGST